MSGLKAHDAGGVSDSVGSVDAQLQRLAQVDVAEDATLADVELQLEVEEARILGDLDVVGVADRLVRVRRHLFDVIDLSGRQRTGRGHEVGDDREVHRRRRRRALVVVRVSGEHHALPDVELLELVRSGADRVLVEGEEAVDRRDRGEALGLERRRNAVERG
jgi:hypothetical protein